MSQTQRNIRRANELLRELDSVFPGGDGIHPLFQLRWSEDLVSLIPQFTCEGEPVMEYRCSCGTDVRVHSASCGGITVAKVKIIKVPSFGLEGEFQSYADCWVLCRWQAPPPKSDWIDMMGTDEDYPQNGRYIPVHRGPMCVVIPPRTDPREFERIARFMVDMLREQRATWRDEIAKDKEKAQKLQLPIEDSRGNVIRDPDKDTRYWRIYEAAREKMRLHNPTGTVGYTKAIEESVNG